jgi:YidC/Oxa1 family membrane protein insertase
MSVYSLFDPALILAHSAITTLATALHPLTGGASVVIALVALTLLVRAGLLPFAVSVLRAERSRRALAPELARLRKRHAGDPARLLRELQAAHQRAGISPLAGLLPGLAQAPVLFVVYRLCRVPVIAGVPNAVLTANLFGAPLATHGPAVLLSAGLLSLPSLVVVGLLLALLLVAYRSSVQQVRRVREASAGDAQAMQVLIARLLPYGTVAAAMAVPLAVALYLLTSTAWAVTERALLPRLVS